MEFLHDSQLFGFYEFYMMVHGISLENENIMLARQKMRACFDALSLVAHIWLFVSNPRVRRNRTHKSLWGRKRNHRGPKPEKFLSAASTVGFLALAVGHMAVAFVPSSWLLAC
jgi:hypothetical protein